MMPQNTSRNIIFVFVALAAMATGIWLGSTSESSQSTNKAAKIHGVILPKAKTLEPFKLVNHREQAFTLDSFRGHWSLLFVGYTQCPDACPTALSLLKQVHKLMTEQSLNMPEIIFISVDPERDTLPLLSDYINYFNTEFIAVTGSIEALKSMTRQLSVVFSKSPGSSGKITADDYLFDHSTSFILINPQAKLQSFITAPHTVKNVINSIVRSQEYFNLNN